MINEHWQFDRIRIDRRFMRDENVMKRHLYTSIERNQHETHQSIQWEKKKNKLSVSEDDQQSRNDQFNWMIIMKRRLLKPSQWSIQPNDHYMKRRLSKSIIWSDVSLNRSYGWAADWQLVKKRNMKAIMSHSFENRHIRRWLDFWSVYWRNIEKSRMNFQAT